MSSTSPPYLLGRILTATYFVFALVLITIGVVQVVSGNTVGWLLILLGPITVLVGYVRVSQLRQAREKRTNLE